MSIEFACPVCHEVVRTPAGTEGKRGQCPHCQHIFTIPQRSTTKPLAIRIGSDGKIEFSCAGCGQLVRVPRSAAGKRGQCPHCLIIVQIPEVANLPATPAAESVTMTPDGDLEFPCPKCRQSIRTPSNASGKRGMCPHCEATFVIPDAPPQRQQARAETVAKPKGPAARSTSSKPSTASPAADLTEFNCPKCGRHFRLPAGLAGRKGRCPDCQTTVIIPARGAKPSIAGPAEKRQLQPEKETAAVLEAELLSPVDDVAGLDGLTLLEEPKHQLKQLTPLKPIRERPKPIGLTPLDETAGLTPIDDSAGLTPIDATAGLTPIDASSGLTPIDAGTGLTPIDVGSGLTPIDDARGPGVIEAPPGSLLPINNAANLTPISAATGLTPVSDSGLTPISPLAPVRPIAAGGPVDDGSSLIPLRESATISEAYGRQAHSAFTVGTPSSDPMNLLYVGLLCSGIWGLLAGMIVAIMPLAGRGSALYVFFGIVFLLLGLLQIYAAYVLRQRRGYGWCLAASAAAFVGCVSLPVGIFGLATLLKPGMRESFD